MQKNFFILLMTLLSFSSLADDKVLAVDFDRSMGISNLPQYHLMLRSDDSEKLLNFYRDLYNLNNFTHIVLSATPKIPKVIHHIWLGPRPVPELYLEYASKCRAIHPDWDYKLWLEGDILKENFDAKYMQLFDNFKNLYSGKKDVAEYLILYKYGGIVMDMDFKCIKPFDELNNKYDFYAGLEPGVKWSVIPVMTNAIIGSRPKNEVFIITLDKAIDRFNEVYTQKNSFIKRYIRKIKNIMADNNYFAVPDPRHILMLPLGQEVFLQKERMGKMIILPATYFNPEFPDQSADYSFIDKIKIKFGIYSGKNYFNQIRPETIASQDFKD